MSRLLRGVVVAAVILAFFAVEGALAAPSPIVSPLPLVFEENRGQLPAGAHFAARGKGASVLISTDATRLVAAARDPRTPPPTVILRWQGSDPTAALRAEDELPGVRNYFRGSDPEGWHTGIRTWARVRHENVYPGIDVVYRGRGADVEIALVVAAAADPARAVMAFDGADGIEVEGDGTLHLGAGGDEIVLSPPLIYQRRGNELERIDGAYRLIDDRTVGFDIGPHDPSRELVIDPVVLGSASRLGGSDFDRVEELAVGPDNHIYLTGQTRSDDFLGASSPAAGDDAFVTRLTPDGRTVVYTTFLGGGGTDGGIGIDADAAGNAYVSGSTASADFPILRGFQTTRNGDEDAFFAQLDKTGTLLYSSYYGGSDLDGQFDGGIAVHSSGRAYATGRTETVGAGLPAVNAFQASCAVASCGFVAGFNPSLSGPASLIYSSYVGGDGEEAGLAIDVDAAERLYVFGFTSSDAGLIDPAQGFQGATGDLLQRDHFLLVLDPSRAPFPATDQRVYSTYIGGTDDESEGGDIDADASGVVVVASQTESSAAEGFPVSPSAFQTDTAGGTDGYVAKIDTTKVGPASRIFVTFLGGSAADFADGVAADSGGRVWVGMSSASADFPLKAPLPQFPPPGPGSISGIVVQLAADGQTLMVSTPMASAFRLAVDSSDRVHVAGSSVSSFPLFDGLPPSPLGGVEIFLARLDPAVDRGLTLEIADTRDPSGAGQPFAFEYVIRNLGEVKATAVTLSSPVPGGLTFDGVTAGCTLPGAQTDCALDDLEVGENVPVYLRARSGATGVFNVAGTAGSAVADPSPADNTTNETITIAVSGAVTGALACGDFDARGNRFDIGAFCLDTARGILASPNGSLDDTVNLMNFDGSMPIHVVDILGQGEIAFGFVERATWTPSASPPDTFDLFGRDGTNPVDRVFATVDQNGLVELWTADSSVAGRKIAEGAVDLARGGKLELEIDKVTPNARVLYDGFVVAQGNPFTADPLDAAAAQVGDDQVISIAFGTESRGAVTINNHALRCPNLVLANLAVATKEIFAACETIFAGPNFSVTGDVTFRAGESVVLANGTTLGPGSTFTVEILPALKK